jgi:hypothetical protein
MASEASGDSWRVPAVPVRIVAVAVAVDATLVRCLPE